MFALIVPYRNREYNPAHLILNLQWYLDPDTFDMIVVEQVDERAFNRGYAFNAGFDLARRNRDHSHYVLQDADLIPQQADYSRPHCPTHLSAATSPYHYEVPYEDSFGGLVLFNQSNFEAVNGFSNHYWGWGREDFVLRFSTDPAAAGYERFPASVADFLAGPENRLCARGGFILNELVSRIQSAR